MYTQNKARGLSIRANLRRTGLAAFAVCLLASVALLSVISGGGGYSVGDKPAYAAGETHPEWNKYDSSYDAGLGSGSFDHPWLIGNATQLYDLANKVNGYGDSFRGDSLFGYYIKLTADIDLSAYGAAFNRVGYTGWAPIGKSASKYFEGNFDGDGFTISNLFIGTSTDLSNNYVGLFGHIGARGVIKNLVVSGTVNTTALTNPVYAGGIAGSNAGSIINCYTGSAVTGAVANNRDSDAGGIAGYNAGSITSCYNYGSVNVIGDCSVGGITGYNNGNIENCYNTGSLTSEAYAGGIVGQSPGGGTITSCYNAGSVTGNTAGGIIGFNKSNITSSYYNKEKFTGAAVGSGTALGYAADLTTAQMTADDTLTAGGATGLGGAFVKRENDTANGILYYPELKAFAESANPEAADASRLSVAIGETGGIILTITYDYQGATENNERRFDLVEDYHLYKLTVPARRGYAFLGWYDAAIGGTQYDTDLDGCSLIPINRGMGNRTFYAQWEAYTYTTVTYNANGGTGGTMPNSTHTYDADEKLAANGYLKTGYTLAAWNTLAGGGGDAYAAGDSIRALTANSGGTTLGLYAQWTANSYTVSYDGNGNTGGSTEASTHTYDADEKLAANGYLKTGYAFTGWNTLAGGSGDAYAAGDSIRALTANSGGTLSLYAQWTANSYTVTLDPDYAGSSTTAVSATYGSAMPTEGVSAPSRAGYIFGGYYSGQNGGGTQYYNAAMGSEHIWNIASTRTLYGKWTEVAGGENNDDNGGDDMGGGADNGGGQEPIPLTIPVVSAVAALGLIFVIRGIYFKRRRRAAAAFAGRRGGLSPMSVAPGVSYNRINAQPNGLRQANHAQPNGFRQPNPYAQQPTPGNPDGKNNSASSR